MQKTYSKEQLSDIANWVFEQGKDHSIWLLRGEMGSGKTTISSEVIKKLSGVQSVASPTYALINEYNVIHPESPYRKIFHTDLYRLRSVEEALEAGIEVLLHQPNALTIIEWPDIISPILPSNYLSLQLEHVDEDTRRISLSVHV